MHNFNGEKTITSPPPPPATGPVLHVINIYFHSDSGELLTHNPNFGENAAQHVQLKKKKKRKMKRERNEHFH